MEQNSPTEDAVQQPASNEPTGQEAVVQQPAESTNQETNPQGSVTNDTAQQQNNDDGANNTDAEIASFAKGQGIEDTSQLTEREQKLLKVAYDNQKFARTNKAQPKITDATSSMGDGSLESKVAQLEYERTTDSFWSTQGSDGKPKFDRSKEAAMTQILYDKVEQLTPTLGKEEAKKYAFNLSRDLDTLYAMANMGDGSNQAPVDAEAIRRQERESMNQRISAGAPSAHATQGVSTPQQQVTESWIENEYDSRNPEHRKLADAYFSQNS